MTHHHHHRGAHAVPEAALGRAFAWGIALNTAFVAIEAAVGIAYDSMGLLSDAGHNLSDVASLLLALLAYRLARVHARPRYTYGYRKSTVLVSLLNSVVLLVAVGAIVAESIGRMLHPMPVEGGVIAWTAGAGVAVNGFTAWLFVRDKERDLNVKGAYLHMAADALVSVGVLVSGLVIARTGWMFVDPVIGVVADARQPAPRARRRAAGARPRVGGARHARSRGRMRSAPPPSLGHQHHGERPDGACRSGARRAYRVRESRVAPGA